MLNASFASCSQTITVRVIIKQLQVKYVEVFESIIWSVTAADGPDVCGRDEKSWRSR